jgi:phage terminase large subunit-like protein
VIVGCVDNVWQVECIFWLPAEGLVEKGKQDHVDYAGWAKAGFLRTCPGKTVDYDFVAHDIAQLLKDRDVKKVAYDPWHFSHLKAALMRCGVTEPKLEAKFQEFRQGYKTMAEALNVLEDKLRNGLIAHGDHPILSKCAFDAVVDMDPAGNRKFTKAKSTGRIDGIVALAMAMGVALFENERPFTII